MHMGCASFIQSSSVSFSDFLLFSVQTMHSFFFFFWLPHSTWNYQAKDQTQGADVTYLSHCAGPGIEPATSRLGSGVAVAWRRPAAAALIPPLAWEPPYAVGVALKRQKKLQNILKVG